MIAAPLVSVLLPVRNGMPYIVEAVDSVLSQTFSDFEVIVVNDGSTDGTENYIRSLGDARVVLLNTTGVGLVEALNLGLEKCGGKYIARMDADDVCDVHRFAEQVRVLEGNELIGLVCSDIYRIDEGGKAIGEECQKVVEHDDFRRSLLGEIRHKPIIHPSVLVRADLLHRVGGYRHYKAAEDRDLWLRLVGLCQFFRINKKLLRYRITSNGVSRSQRSTQLVSGQLALINHIVYERTGVDMYEKKSVLLEDLRRILDINAELRLMAALDFDVFKMAFRSGRFFYSVSLFFCGLKKHGAYFFPAKRASEEVFLCKRLAMAMCSIVSSGRDSVATADFYVVSSS